MSQNDRGRSRGQGGSGYRRGRGDHRGRGGSHSQSRTQQLERPDSNPLHYQDRLVTNYHQNEYPASQPQPQQPYSSSNHSSVHHPHHHLPPHHPHPPPPPPQYRQPAGPPYNVSVPYSSQHHPVQYRDPHDAYYSRAQDPHYRDNYYDHPRPDPFYGDRPHTALSSYGPGQERHYPRNVNPSYSGHGNGHRSDPTSQRGYHMLQQSHYQDAREKYPPNTYRLPPEEPPPPSYESFPHELANYPEELQRRSGTPPYPKRGDHNQREGRRFSVDRKQGREKPCYEAEYDYYYSQRSRLSSASSGVSIDSNTSTESRGYNHHQIARKYHHNDRDQADKGTRAKQGCDYNSNTRSGKRLGHGESVESLPSQQERSNFSSPRHEEEVGSHISQGSRDRGKGRGRGRSWNRGRGSSQGRGGFQQRQKGKFQSMPNLVDGESYVCPEDSDEHVENEDKLDRDSSMTSASRSQRGRRRRRHRGTRGFSKELRVRREQKSVSPDQASEEDSDSHENDQEKETPVRMTRAALLIMMGFKNANKLKETIYKYFDTSERVDLQIVEASVVCSDKQGACVLILHTDSKQLAKRAVKSLSQRLRKSLKTNVTFEISSAEEEKNVKKGQPSDVISSVASKKRKKAEKILQGLNEPASRSGTQNGIEKPSSVSFAKGKQDEISNDTFCNREACDASPSQEQNPMPTKLTVTVDKVFPENKDLLNFLNKAVGDKASHFFELLSESIAKGTSKTFCEVKASSKAAAKRIVKQLNTSRLDEVRIRCQIVNDNPNPDTASKSDKDITSKFEEMESKIKRALEATEVKKFKALEVHEKKINTYEKALNVMESSNIEDEDDRSEELALRDKLIELIKQKDEFETCIHRLEEKMDPSVISDKDLNSILQTVGVECQRIASGLPMYARRGDIVKQVTSNQVSIILGETGSGKSTQMTQYLYEAGLAGEGQIVCTQPRKVAAITLAERVAKEMAGKVGNLVGYKTGVKKRLSQLTKIIYSTDHCLLNECLADPKLSNYTCIIVDEAHERSIYTDILLGMIKACLAERPDLKVVITSATIDPEVFIQYFGSGPELRVSGRTFPVEVVYTDTDNSQEFENFEIRAVQKAEEVHKNGDPGDILIFLTSPVEIMRCCEAFEKAMKDRSDYKCFPLHGQLPSDEQKKVFDPLPEGKRKVVFSTNCAETSITIDGIKYVIDTGVAKEVRYDAKRNISLLGTHIISKSSADQRKGRAGRTASGKCYRLYSEESYHSMTAITEPEILRVHLGQAVLKLAELGVDVKTYDFVQSPSADAIDTALATLRELGALSPQGITEIGRWISKLPFDPRQGYLVYEGNKRNMLYETVILASLISNGSNLFYKGLTESEEQKSAMSKNKFGSRYGDIFTWMDVYKTWIQQPKDKQSKWCGEHCINYKVMSFTKLCVSEAATVLERELGTKMNSEFSTDELVQDSLRRIVFDANISSVCHYLGHIRAGYFALVVERQVHFHPSSALVAQNAQPPWVVYTEFTKTSRDFIKGITAIEEEWVLEAINQGKLSVDIATAKQRRIDVVHREEVGPLVFRNLVGPRYSNLRSMEEDLTNAGMTTVVVEADRELGTLDIYSSSDMDPGTVQKIKEMKAEVIEKLKSDEEEMAILKTTGKDQCGFRVVLGQGGAVRTTLLPGQSNKVIIKRPDHETTEEDVRVKFGVFGEIKECVRFQHSNTWGFLRYGSYVEAQAAVQGTSKDENNAAVLKLDGQVKRVRNKFEAKLSWCRRPVKGKGTAFIKCPPIEKAELVGKRIYLPAGGFSEIKISNKDDLMLHDTGNAQESDIKKAVMNILGYDERSEENIQISLVRERVDVSTEAEKNNLKLLSDAFMAYIAQDKFTLRLNKVKPGSVYQVGFIQFDNPVEGFRACEGLNGNLYIKDQRVEISPDLKTTIHVPAAIMRVCGARFQEIIKGLAEYKNTEVKLRTLRQGDSAVDIKSSSPKHIIEAREVFQRELEGEPIDCGADDLLRSLLKKQGRAVLHNIEDELGILIMIDDRREKIHIYGAEKDVTQAQTKINGYLSKIAKGKQVDVCFKGPGKPPGLLKALMRKYENLHDDLVEQFALSDVIINFKQQKISIIGSQESVDLAYTSILEVEHSISEIGVQQKERWMPDCVVCMCPVDGSSELYRLEGCGHSYCLDCLKNQIGFSIDNKSFPMTCAQENCNMAIVWKDFHQFLQKKWATEEKLVQRSVNAFVSANPNEYRFCLTPNCPVFYEITTSEEGSEFNCPACFVSLCTSCHTAYHTGLTCRMAESQAQADQQLEEWRERNADRCKRCPGCKELVEKIEGCNKMHCSCGTYFCWVCLLKCDDEQKTYAHLVKQHGGFS